MIRVHRYWVYVWAIDFEMQAHRDRMENLSTLLLFTNSIEYDSYYCGQP